jgi:uncharacterized protein (DUF983 family)
MPPAESPATPPKSYAATLLRGWRLRCPRCGQGGLFRDWFHMREKCEVCGLDFGREPGFYLGSIYINYGLTSLLVTIIYFSLFFTTEIQPQVLLWSLVAFCVVFPLWFFRYARSLWLAFDQYWDPDAAKGQHGKRPE